MNLDIIDSILSPALAVLLPTVLISQSTLDPRSRRRFAVGIGLWFVVIVGLASQHFFSIPKIGSAAVGLAVALPLITAAIALRNSPALRTLASGVPLSVLVAVNIGRLVGGQFLILHAMNRLPSSFAHSAGWGDVLVGALAIPLSLAVHRRIVGWRSWAWIWNVLGTLDLAAAVTLGTGSAPNSPLRFIHETPDSGIMGELPWVLIPGFLVPFYLIIHLFVYRQLLTTLPAREGEPSLRSATVS